MTRQIKQLLKKFLKKHNRKLIYLHSGGVSGYDLIEDLRIIIKDRYPVCLDVGANEGQTIEMLNDALREPIIYCFEPASVTYNKLRSKEYSTNISLFNCAIGRECGEKELIIYENSCLNSFLAMEKCDKNPFRNAQIEYKETVQVNTIDWFVNENQIEHVELLKSDTQGFDLDVLIGARKSFEKSIIQNVLVELNFIQIYGNQSHAFDIINYLNRFDIYLTDFYEKVYQGNRLSWCTALFSKC